MGMYTEISFAAQVDAEAFAILTEIQKTGDMPTPAPHPFFEDDRARMVFSGSGSYYFPGACHFTLESDSYVDDLHSVSLRADIKNYDRTIEAFFDWITPHVVEGAGERGYIGHMIYEEAEVPTLFYASLMAP